MSEKVFKRMPEKDCIFCKIARKEIPTEKVYESKNFYAFPDKNPASRGHTLIIPKKHFVNIMDLPESLASELIDTIKEIAKKRIKEGAEGFNLVMNNFPAAGQIVMHAHLHLIPRKKSDGVKINH